MKCSYYYEFEKLLKNSLIITSSFVMKSTRFDTNDSKISFENKEKKNEKKKNAKKKTEKTNTNAQKINIKKNDYEN
jgi:mannitol-specific phosphotransferase system IIBC component